MNYPIKSLLLLVGDDEFADSPAGVNKHLFANYKATWLDVPLNLQGIAKVQINPKAAHARAGSRMLIAMKFTRTDGSEFIQPFYRSSGRSTPELSQEGEWWPCSGLYTAAYCRWRNMSLKYEGHIGKHQRVTMNHRTHGGLIDAWVNHEKDRTKVHPMYQMCCEFLATVPIAGQKP